MNSTMNDGGAQLQAGPHSQIAHRKAAGAGVNGKLRRAWAVRGRDEKAGDGLADILAGEVPSYAGEKRAGESNDMRPKPLWRSWEACPSPARYKSFGAAYAERRKQYNQEAREFQSTNPSQRREEAIATARLQMAQHRILRPIWSQSLCASGYASIGDVRISMVLPRSLWAYAAPVSRHEKKKTKPVASQSVVVRWTWELKRHGARSCDPCAKHAIGPQNDSADTDLEEETALPADAVDSASSILCMNWAPIPLENSGSTSDGCCYSIISLNAIACTFASVFPTLWTPWKMYGEWSSCITAFVLDEPKDSCALRRVTNGSVGDM
ncbi:hypothetical protein BDZ89DRAFT_1112292 [Hymenopellis radicata]|nr:hypothetical protein BDZ89DRAFT_1112292 [Hymenopellis radicata]